ncbi:MAG: response regulator transcription factor [Proteobacteria bacterium]|nr:response regulator transcription factor [Pseudomonadota bacterium]
MLNSQLPPKKILLIDDHAMVRSAIAAMVKGLVPSVETIEEAGTGRQGLNLYKKIKPELVILDFKLPDISGLEVAHRLSKANPKPTILVLTSECFPLVPAWLVSAGAQGFLSKSATREEFKQTLLKLLATNSTHQKKKLKKDQNINLSLREIEVMRLVLQEKSVLQIAKCLNLDTQTVYSYRSAIFKKLKIKNEVDLMLLALKKGIVELEDF